MQVRNANTSGEVELIVFQVNEIGERMMLKANFFRLVERIVK